MDIYYCKKNLSRKVELINNHKIIGDFCIYGELNSGTTCSMTISIEDDYQKKGYSRILMNSLIERINNEMYVRPDQLLFIDADASGGFWDHIGMTENRYGFDYNGRRDFEGRGYEKCITWYKLNRYAKGKLS